LTNPVDDHTVTNATGPITPPIAARRGMFGTLSI
jgi:hypothetical protein